MPVLTLAAAQSVSIAGNLEANIARHLCFIRQAAEQGVQLLIFPELSLTGYEPQLAAALAIPPDDAVLQPLRDCARECGLTAVVGMPVRGEGGAILIGALVLTAEGSQALYTKQHLHSGEEVVFTAGGGGEALQFGDDRIALAVCADFSHASHAAQAAHSGADVYAAGVLISEGGYATDSGILQGYAAEHQMVVLMANHGGPTGGWVSAGRSAVWGADGVLVASAEGAGDVLVVARREGGTWSGKLIDVDLPC